MSIFDPAQLDRQALYALDDTLIVHGPSGADGADMPFLLIDGAGRIFGFNGHVDLGTGIRTALTQIVAEELDLPPSRVSMILGDTARTPDQSATIASDTIQTTAVPLRAAAAQARAWLAAAAAERLDVPADQLRFDEGLVGIAGDNRRLSFGELVEGHRARLVLDRETPVKPASAYRLVGTSTRRVDIPAKAAGDLTFVHDMRVPGMLHGRVVRPPYAGVDAGDFVGNSLIAVDEGSIAHIPGIIKLVVIGDFIGIVATREEWAVAAMQSLRAEWKPTPSIPDLGDLATAISANPSTARRLQDKGDVEGALDGAASRLDGTYVWPYQMHGSIGPSCAVADYHPEGLRVWTGTQNPHPLRADLARLLDLPPERIDVVRMEAAGCYGRNCADDVAADAALLSRAVGAPVRVQLSREQEHLWEPKGTGQLMQVAGALDAAGNALAYDYQSRYPSNGAPTLALLLTGKIPPIPAVFEMGDRTSIAPYDYPNMRVTIHDMPPIVRASWIRGVSALPNSFAHESWIDEAAAMAGVDPVEYRLRYLRDQRGIAVVEATAERAGWTAHTRPQTLGGEGDLLHGRGFAYALYVHSKFPGYGAAWAAWVADVTVNRRTGEVAVTKVTVGHDAGLMVNPEGVRHQIHGNVIQSTSRALKEQVTFDDVGVVASEWGGYPIITFPEVPEIDVLMLPRPDQPPLGAGESASVPSAAAIANALYDATGIRFREPPFTPEKVRAALHQAGLLTGPLDPQALPPPRRAGLWARLTALGAGAAALLAIASPWRPSIAPIERPSAGLYSAQTIERGRLLAAAGDCAVCHTAPGGITNAGGLAMETPFGTVYSTNITPDPETGIGAWSYPAFERAMRQGISRDGRHLYPAFPYTAFAKISDADMQALYAYLMAQVPVQSQPLKTKLAFPFGMRPLMAGWNSLFLKPSAWRDDPTKSAEWNRGGYLIEGLGHCAACHSPRNLMGAERKGAAHLGGAYIDGWYAPSLTRTSNSVVPWRAEDFYAYLRTGHSPLHGTAAGPMAPVIDEMRQLPDADIRAMATYLASFGDPSVTSALQAELAAAAEQRANQQMSALSGWGARIFDGACAACHSMSGVGENFAIRPSLAVNGTVNAERPDNLIRVILDGIQGEAAMANGTMPGFRANMSDRQIAELIRYVRTRFASERPAWTNLETRVGELRAQAPHRAH
ncbi:aldehyde dehydrogenase [Sphingomonas oleivorans]|uniref:Aldehyde dehydrogenase n=1 Tax=Sphingomonas oleivorans TaxID=1735121 RepID=A0A2T5FU07_9SPHN|nr:molybdopterin cofactor-binding domain-containing protein [Sphingomonas oleivorans]PTQ07774.1 aldehyde dehydrogenase [Sphingomonas oleivorans]